MSEINMTPLIDVMLVLLVIFMLTAPLLTPALRLDLPRAGAAQPQAEPPVVTLVLDAAGQIHLRDQPVSLEALRQQLDEIGQKTPQAEVRLHADESVPYGRVVAVLDALQRAGLHRIGFAARP